MHTHIEASFLVLALMGGPVWAWTGALPLAIWPFKSCPTYKLPGINTCGLKR